MKIADRMNQCLLLITLFVTTLTANQSVGRLSVAEIIRTADKLDGSVVTIRGQLSLAMESSLLGDQSHCDGRSQGQCRLVFAIGNCKITGKRYSELACSAALKQLILDAGVGGLGERLILIENVTVRGTLSTRRQTSPKTKVSPRTGFGQFGAFPVKLSATALDLDNADVRPAQ